MWKDELPAIGLITKRVRLNCQSLDTAVPGLPHPREGQLGGSRSTSLVITFDMDLFMNINRFYRERERERGGDGEREGGRERE